MKHFKPAVAAFFVLLASPAIAKDLPITTLNPVIVTANPLGRSSNDLTQPVTVLAGDDLLKKLQPTIGETLSSELGIRSTYFGPNASRPVIRGLYQIPFIIPYTQPHKHSLQSRVLIF